MTTTRIGAQYRADKRAHLSDFRSERRLNAAATRSPIGAHVAFLQSPRFGEAAAYSWSVARRGGLVGNHQRGPGRAAGLARSGAGRQLDPGRPWLAANPTHDGQRWSRSVPGAGRLSGRLR